MVERLLAGQEQMIANRKADQVHMQEMLSRLEVNTKAVLEKMDPDLEDRRA
jgi:hypothetical protein